MIRGALIFSCISLALVISVIIFEKANENNNFSRYGANLIAEKVVSIDVLEVVEFVKPSSLSIAKYNRISVKRFNSPAVSGLSYKIFAKPEFESLITSKIHDDIYPNKDELILNNIRNCNRCIGNVMVEIIFLCNRHIYIWTDQQQHNDICLPEYDINGNNVIWANDIGNNLMRNGLLSHLIGTSDARIHESSIRKHLVGAQRYGRNTTASIGQISGNYLEISGFESIQGNYRSFIPLEWDKSRFDDEKFSFFYPLNNEVNNSPKTAWCIIDKGKNEKLESLVNKTKLCIDGANNWSTTLNNHRVK